MSSIASFILTFSSFSPQTFNTSIFLKLDDDKFLLCQQQVLATVKGLQLMKILEGCDILPQFSLHEDLLNIMNQEFINHEQWDQLLAA